MATKVEILYFDGCPSYAEAEGIVREALAKEGVKAEVKLVAVETDEEARRLRFPGSPTIRADGRDLFPGEATERNDWGLGCRIYATPEGFGGTPTPEMVRAALSGSGGPCCAAAPCGSAGDIDAAEDVFFLVRAELGGREDLRARVAGRRQRWERQRRLAAPLALGEQPRAMRTLVDGLAEAARTRPVSPAAILVGEPASPGRATGRVRVVDGPEDFDGFLAGEVLVARLTAPAWTPLFGRAAAVVTDGGTLAAHASLVAREYGIPAVVGTGDATRRFRIGMVVTVDGGAGVVEGP